MKTGSAKVKDVADHLSLHPETVRTMARKGQFKNAYKVGNSHSSQIRIPWQSVYEYEQTQPRVSA
ncbi:hypothetical protein QFZ79_002943 [Arthrobacter sp. V4I6]|uniref:helix-turn-helix domain-containing protein n=1 Tax=Arthrobacter sp. V4I6 TaxID=3042281 RepID=UPI0027807F29|nr:helix-turn-helix domain-containing protein [Arthrobacter sp. V4I6]MDQ0854832.1 hypothetical protein [Arthrobacter sp. V4I6]